jgi:hypothetical protein
MKKAAESKIRTLLDELSRVIIKNAKSSVERLADKQFNARPATMPFVWLSESEVEALKRIEIEEATRSGLIKFFVNSSIASCVHFFSVMDAMADPDEYKEEIWTAIGFGEVEKEDKGMPMLHDEFTTAYYGRKDRV